MSNKRIYPHFGDSSGSCSFSNKAPLSHRPVLEEKTWRSHGDGGHSSSSTAGFSFLYVMTDNPSHDWTWSCA